MSETVKAGALFASWGKSVQHVIRDGAETTCCGRTVPSKVRLTIYPGIVCRPCTKADPEAVEMAERWRQGQYERMAAKVREHHDEERDGRFRVFRCRTCGAQVSGEPGSRACTAPGVEFHMTDPEELVVVGPVWVPPIDAGSPA